MAFGLEKTSVTLDDIPFEAFKEVNSENYYFAERVAIMGILNFGLVTQGEEVMISLAANGITTPVTIESLFAFTPEGTSDEVYLSLYVQTENTVVRIGKQRVNHNEMPYNIPTGIILPNMILSVIASRSDLTIVAYVKPVAIGFEAVPNPSTVGNSNDGKNS